MVGAKFFGIAKRPRLCVFRSNKHIYAQLVNDEERKTLLSVSDHQLPKSKLSSKEKPAESKKPFTAKMAKAYEVG